MMFICNILGVFCLFGIITTLPHPIRYADNRTKCEFLSLPTGYLGIGKEVSVPGQCMLIKCHEDLTISGLTCPTHFVLPGCHLTPVDNFREYPDCCPQVVCNFVDFKYVDEDNHRHYKHNYNY